MKCDAVYKFYVKELPKYECVLCVCSLKMGNERQRLYSDLFLCGSLSTDGGSALNL